MKVLILAGGSGTRLWPLSRGSYPKQFVKLFDSETSLFQDTFKRSMLLAEVKDIYVVTNGKYKYLVMGEVEELGFKYNEDNILVEPEAKNTLPAICYGVYRTCKTNRDTIVVFPSDHIIKKGQEFADIIRGCEGLARDSIITFGIKPGGPNTGYGYISPGAPKGNGFCVKEFKEKPGSAAAETYVESGYLWNSGIFMFNCELFTEELKLHSRDIFDAFNSTEEIRETYLLIEKGIAIDYGIMEKTDKAVVVPVDIGWNDLGSFDSFYEVFDKDDSNNIVTKGNILIESGNNLIHSDTGKAVAAIGVDNLIVIDKKDALLICKKDQSQKVKDIVNALIERHDPRTEYHLDD